MKDFMRDEPGAPAVVDQDTFQAFSPLVESYVGSGLFSGSVLVVYDSRPQFRQSFGLANREWGIPVTPDTKFRIGSVTKQFTAASYVQYLQEYIFDHFGMHNTGYDDKRGTV